MFILMWFWDLFDWLIDPAGHFVWAFCLGVWVWRSTSTIRFAPWWVKAFGRPSKAYTAAVFITIFCRVLLALSLAFLSHYLLDYGWLQYTKPLDPPLDLKVWMVN